MTTDNKNRLSDLGKKWKEKLTAKQAAEEAQDASPAENAAPMPEEMAEASPAANVKEAASADTDAPEGAADTARDAESGPASADREAEEREIPAGAEEEKSGRITQEDLAAVLLAFGWHVPESEGLAAPSSGDAALSSPALEELTAEVTSAMEGFIGDAVNVYEEEPSAAPAAEELPAQPVSQETHVFPVIAAEEPAEASAEAPEQEPEAEPAEGPAEETPAGVPEEDEDPTSRIDAKELFSGMNQEILKEVFSEEELSALGGDATHVFKKEELEDISEKQKETEEENRQEPGKRKRKKRQEAKAEPAQPANKRALAQSAEPTYVARDYRPIRRKRSYRTGLRGGLMYFGFVICVSVILASVGWLAADDVLSLNKDYVEADIYVSEKLDMKQVSSELYNKGLIKYPRLFRIFAKLMKAETKVEPGVYSLTSKLDYNAMVHAMHQSKSSFEERATVKVTIPEGKTLKQTFQILAEHGVCPYETLLECSADYEFKYDFLADLPYGEETRLEGYLFPDTYEFFAPSDPEEAIDKFLSNFNSKITAEMRVEASESGYSLHEIVTVASLVEMEAGKDTERATIASVIYNRLNSSYYPYLQIDATIQYAMEERKESLSYEDLEIDSPYNTYKYTGLPPGPIANPGLASIRAALAPEDTGYYFYALNKSGSHNFFATQSQFDYFVNSSEFGG